MASGKRVAGIGWRFWLAFLALGLVLVLVPGSVGGGVSLATAAGTADFSVSVKDGPTTSAPGVAFSFTVEVSSVGPDPVSGSVVSVEQPGATGVVAPTDCVATGGAVCPTSWTVSASKLTGTLGNVPVNGKVTFSFQGKFPATISSGTSVSTTATVVVPAGVSDPNLGGNTSVQATTFPQGTATITKSVALVNIPGTPLLNEQRVPSGSVFVWTITVKNTGSVPISGVKLFDNLSLGADAFLVENQAGSMVCEIDGVACAVPPVLTTSGNALISNSPVSDLPAGKTLVIKFQTKLTLTDCGEASFSNTVTFWGSNLPSFSASTQRFYVTGDPCPTFTVAKSVALASNPTVPLSGGSANPIVSGSVLEWTITVRNTSQVTLTQVKVTDWLSLRVDRFQAANVAGSLTCVIDGVACAVAPPLTTFGTQLIPTRSPVSDIPVGGTLTLKWQTKIDSLYCGTNPTLNTVNVYAGVVNFRSAQSPQLYFVGQPCPSYTFSYTTELASNPGVPLPGGEANSVPSGSELVHISRLKNTSNTTLTGVKFQYWYDWASRVSWQNVVGSLVCELDGVPCSLSLPLQTGADQSPFSGAVRFPDIPAGAELVIKWKTKVANTSCTSGLARAAGQLASDAIPPTYFYSSSVYFSSFDLGVSVGVSAQSVLAGGGMFFDLSLVNACPVESGTRLVWELPAARDFVFGGVTSESVQCTAPAGKTCPTFTFDPVTRKLTADFVGVAQSAFKVKVLGQGGVVKGVSSPTKVSLVSPLGDLNLASDTAQVTYVIENDQSKIKLDYLVTAKDQAGTVLAGVPAALPVSGKVVCELQGEFPWSVTIAKDTQTVLWERLVWNQDTCRVVLDQVAAPSGWRWKTALAATGTDLGAPVVQSVDRTVMVRGELEPDLAGFMIAKYVSNCDVGVPSCALVGASFAIYNTDPNTAGAAPLSGVMQVEPGGNRVAVTGLAPGDYWVVESRSPGGFSLLATPVRVRLASGGGLSLLADYGQAATVTPAGAGVDAVLQIRDATVTELPKAGGPGIWWLALAGTLLLAAGLALHQTNKRRN